MLVVWPGFRRAPAVATVMRKLLPTRDNFDQLLTSKGLTLLKTSPRRKASRGEPSKPYHTVPPERCCTFPGRLGTRLLERNVAVLAALVRRVHDGVKNNPARFGRLNDLVYDANGEGARQPADDLVVLRSQAGLDLLTLVGWCRGKRAPVQDADCRNRAHDGHLGARPGEHLRRAERAGVHRDVCPAVGLACDQRHPRHHRFCERVQQLGATAYHAVP